MTFTPTTTHNDALTETYPGEVERALVVVANGMVYANTGNIYTEFGISGNVLAAFAADDEG